MSLLRSKLLLVGERRELSLPLSAGDLGSLRSGDLVSLTGSMYTGRDVAHRRLCSLLEQGRELPVNLDGETLYYVGPSPPRPGRTVGAAGPTTSRRMDPYTPLLLQHGLKAMLGKGSRSVQVRQAMLENGAVYLATFGGAGAFLSQYIMKVQTAAFADAGPEAMFLFEVENFPAVVINDVVGRDFYEMAGKGR
jgi:fumarate hydratase subunit beta